MPSNAASQQAMESPYSSSSKGNHRSSQSEKPIAQLTSKNGGSSVKNAQLFSSRRGNEKYSAAVNNINNPSTKPSISDRSPATRTSNHDSKTDHTIKTEKYEESIKKKPLDINSLQPMKKKKPLLPTKVPLQQTKSTGHEPTDDTAKVKEEEHHSQSESVQVKKEATDEEAKLEGVDERDRDNQGKKNGNIMENTHSIIDTKVEDGKPEVPNDKAIQEHIKEENSEKGTEEKLKGHSNITATKTNNKFNAERQNESKSKELEKLDNSDDEDEPIHSKTRHVSADVSPIEESEEDTDIEDSIPVPSRKTRRLHRLLQSSALNDSEKRDNTTSSNKPLVSKKRATNSSSSSSTYNSQSSRSQSPKQRKTSRTGRDASGRTLLQRMCAKGNTDEVRRLVQEGQNINDADFAGITPLHEAALEGHYDITVFLLDSGADINVQSGQMDKDTPLIDAVSNLHYKVVQLLLERGANPTIKNAQGQDAIDVLDGAIKEYEDDSEEVPPDAKKIRKLLQQFSQNFAGDIHSKAHKRSRERSTSNASADESHYSGNNQHSYPSLRKGGVNSLQERISANDVTFVLNYVSGMNGKKIPPEALLLASKLGFPDIASLLIAFGADINFKDKNGWTPLMHAVGKGHLEMVKLLLSNQVDVTAKDKKNRTALDILKQNGLSDTEEYTLLLNKIKETSSQEKDDSKMAVDESDAELEEDVDEDEDEEEDSYDISQADESFIDDEETRSGSKKRKHSNREKNEVEKKSLDSGNEEHRILKKQKLNDEKKTISENAATSASPSPSPSVKKTILKQKKKHEEEQLEEKKVIPTPPTAEELEAQRLKEIEAQKAREALEHQRLERKKLKQQEIAKRIDAFEKQREEEKKALERQTLERRRKEEEEQSKLLRKQEESRKKEEIKYAIEKRKLIRSFYPYGLKQAVFHGVTTKSEIEKFLPLYAFKIGDVEYLIDLQLNLLLGIENLYSKYPQLSKRKVRLEEKQGVWNVLWPLIGSFKNGHKPVAELQKVYETEGNNFKELMINWVRRDAFEGLVRQEEDLKDVRESIERIGICHVALVLEAPPSQIGDVNSTVDESKTKSGNNVIDIEVSAENECADFPLRFGKRARTALRMMNKPLW